jgi:S-formylglutathione hydrolase FrmB
MRKAFIGFLVMVLFLSILVSCGKRENPVRVSYEFREPWDFPPKAFSSLQGNILEDPFVRGVHVYLPPQYDPGKHSPLRAGYGFPVLYLLHDFWGTYETFSDFYKVQQIADRLIHEGEIQPMIIVMPDGSNSLGGSFYTNSNLIGRYEDCIVNEIMLMIDTTFHTMAVKEEGTDTDKIVPNPRYKAISGHGMGGYGALKMALHYDTTLFGSVSAMSPFVSFESFLARDMIGEIFTENGIADDDFSLLSYKTISSVPRGEKPLTSLLFAMAAAFSPHDTTDADPDAPYFFELLVKGTKRYGVDLPFDTTRTISPGSEIWNRWMFNHDIRTSLARNAGGGFRGLKVYVDCGDQDQLRLYQGTRAFHQLLSQYGIENTYVEYPGYGSFPAGHSDFVFDRLPEILKFHSRQFPPSQYLGHP